MEIIGLGLSSQGAHVARVTLAREFKKMVPLLVFLIICLSTGGDGKCEQAQNEVVSLGQIINGIEQSLEKCPSLRIKYTHLGWMWLDGKHVPIRMEAVYAHKRRQDPLQMLQYFDVTTYRNDLSTEANSVVHSYLVSFDGHATRVLTRVEHPGVRQGRQPMHGSVLKGYVKGHFLFDGGDLGPFKEVWYLGAKSLSSVFSSTEMPFSVVGHQVWQGLDTVVVEHKVPRKADDPNSREVCYRFWICPERGFLPIKRVFSTDGKVWSERGLYDLIKLPNGLWFPRKIQYPAEQSAIDKVKMPRIWEIREISIDPIPESFFAIEFPAGTRVYDEVVGANYTTY